MEWNKPGIPVLNGNNYAFCTGRIKAYLQAQGFQVWNVALIEYQKPSTCPSDENNHRIYESNGKAKNALLNGLSDFVYVKVMHYKSTIEIWDKLQNIYEGDKKVKEANL